MHLAFVDFVYHYDAARPDMDEPLGGTTSSICFLACELVKAGITCTFFNRVDHPQSAHGIETLPLQALADEILLNKHTAYIFCGRWADNLVNLVRSHTNAPLIAWMHESAFIPPLTPALDTFDAVVFVSEWQKNINQKSIRPHWQQTVIRNAMNPQVANSFPAGTQILPEKNQPPVLLFAGSFARGAFHIPPLLDKIREHRRNFTVQMFCNLDPSRNAEQDAKYIAWLRDQSNITHVGMVGQPELARRMKRASIFIAPNPWPETSCIAMIEALASGMSVISTNRAALPETAHGFARQIAIENADDQTRFDMEIDYDVFAAQILEVMNETPVVTETRLRKQVDYFHAHYQWAQRAGEWITFITKLTA